MRKNIVIILVFLSSMATAWGAESVGEKRVLGVDELSWATTENVWFLSGGLQSLFASLVTSEGYLKEGVSTSLQCFVCFIYLLGAEMYEKTIKTPIEMAMPESTMKDIVSSYEKAIKCYQLLEKVGEDIPGLLDDPYYFLLEKIGYIPMVYFFGERSVSKGISVRQRISELEERIERVKAHEGYPEEVDSEKGVLRGGDLCDDEIHRRAEQRCKEILCFIRTFATVEKPVRAELAVRGYTLVVTELHGYFGSQCLPLDQYKTPRLQCIDSLCTILKDLAEVIEQHLRDGVFCGA
jgi:hypothetical protein